MENTASARIDLGAIRANLAVVRRLCPRSRIMAMVKADAYGHGLLPVARTLSAADGLAVARLQEALLLRSAGITQRVLLLGTLLDEQDLATCAKQNIDVTAHDKSSVASILAQAHRTPLRVWLKLDSGMHRIGLNCDAFVEADRMLSAHAGILELIHMTHFSSADSAATHVMERQLSRFWACHNACSSAKTSLANSAALIANPATHADWVRPGIMLYGENPVGARHPVPLRAAMTARARVIAIRDLEVGEPVGYHGRWTAARPSRIGTVGIGYGDGYPRHARNGTPVWINGNLVPLVGRVSMDSLSVDLTDCGKISVGDEAILWGPQLPAAAVADCANTISYALFTSLNQRVTRLFSTDLHPHQVASQR
jgi:alanine racemase